MKRILLLFIGFWSIASCFAQIHPTDSSITEPHTLYLENKNVLEGQFIEDRPKHLLFLFQGDTLLIHKNEIDRIETNSKKKKHQLDENYLIQEVHGHETFIITQTGFSIPKGRIELKTHYGIVNTVEIGLSDHVSISAGLVTPFILIGGIRFAGSPSENIHIGGGMHVAQPILLGLGSNDPLLIPQISFTMGQPKKFTNISLGRFWLPTDEYSDDIGFLAMGGHLPINKNWRIVLNSMVTWGDGNVTVLPTVLAGWMKRKNRIDFGFFTFIQSGGGGFPIPYISYAHRF